MNNRIDQLANNWENFKQQNDERLKQLSTYGTADPITMHQIAKINKAMDDTAASNRPMSDTTASFYGSNINKYQRAFCNYIRKGVESDLNKQTSLCAVTSQDCGYAVTARMYDYISDIIALNSPMRAISNVIEISGDVLELIDGDKEEISAGWSEAILSDTDLAKPIGLSKKAIPTYQMYAQPKATQKLVDDPRIDIEMWLSEVLTQVFAEQENKTFINGTGSGQPRGIMSAIIADNTVNVKNPIEARKDHNAITQNCITDEDIIKLVYSIPQKYTNNCKFILSNEALQNIRMLKESTTGRYIWQPDFSGKTSNTILGYEIFSSIDMPKLNDGTPPIIFGNFKKAYQIVDRHGINIMRDPFTNKPFIKFYATKTVGGDVINANAVRFLKTTK